MKTSVEAIEIEDCSHCSRSGRKRIWIRDERGELKSHFLGKLLRAGVVTKVPRRLGLELLSEVYRLSEACMSYRPDTVKIMACREVLREDADHADLDALELLLDERRILQVAIKSADQMLRDTVLV